MPRFNVFGRKYGTAVDFDAYKAWRDQQVSSNVDEKPQQNSWQQAAASQDTAALGPAPEGPKMSYQEIVDLIQSGKPIPGIKEIPKTVLEGQGTAASKSTRRKPWEKDAPAETAAPAEATTEATA